MASAATPGTTILFTGDSVTDCGRRDDAERHHGWGYVRIIADQLPEATVINTGIGGDRAVDVRRRLHTDVLDHRADVVSIMVGINDTWRRYDSNDPTSTASYEATYRDILEPVAASGARLVLLEPFLLPVTDEQRAWREDLDPRIDVVHGLAVEYDAILVKTDAALTERAQSRGAATLAADGVHPTDEGHAAIAALWLDAVHDALAAQS